MLHPPTVELSPSSSIRGSLAMATATSDGDGPSSDSVIIRGPPKFPKLDLLGVLYSDILLLLLNFPNAYNGVFFFGVPLCESPKCKDGVLLNFEPTTGEFRNCNLGDDDAITSKALRIILAIGIWRDNSMVAADPWKMELLSVGDEEGGDVGSSTTQRFFLLSTVDEGSISLIEYCLFETQFAGDEFKTQSLKIEEDALSKLGLYEN
ncbi:uncharacterized protein G2W53_044731 [Senna tora]|uniref:Uncharacterized protein n=1 Tax=Senna tora TaxID=362788 RepID=A0A834SEF1_9FABA|nr:uncharacterized protein G2W53_044731 [Senna tora]